MWPECGAIKASAAKYGGNGIVAAKPRNYNGSVWRRREEKLAALSTRMLLWRGICAAARRYIENQAVARRASAKHNVMLSKA